jgi:hypothetical protein
MDRLSQYRELLKKLMSEYASHKPSYGDVQVEKVFDETQDHYEVTYAGWVKSQRVHGPILHVDIRGGKFWIQHDGTEGGIANDLVEAGISKDQIVLAFQPPQYRQHTGFGVD